MVAGLVETQSEMESSTSISVSETDQVQMQNWPGIVSTSKPLVDWMIWGLKYLNIYIYDCFNLILSLKVYNE